MILRRYVASKFIPTYAASVAMSGLMLAGVFVAGPRDFGPLDVLPILGFPATIAGVVAFSSLACDRELLAMYAAGISLPEVCSGVYLCSAAIPILAIVIGAVDKGIYGVLAPAVVAIGASAVGVSVAAITASEFARREIGVVWLTSVGVLIVFYLGEAKIASLGNHPIFDACCTIILTAAMLCLVWYLHNHIRDFF